MRTRFLSAPAGMIVAVTIAGISVLATSREGTVSNRQKISAIACGSNSADRANCNSISLAPPHGASTITLADAALRSGPPAPPQERASALRRASLNENEVISLLSARVSPAQVSERARKQGIDFVVSEPVEQQLRKAGADDELIQTLRQIQPQGLVWGPARHVATVGHGLYDISNLVTQEGKHYLAFTGDDKHVRLASDATGTWKVYPVYSNSDVGNGSNQWYVGLAVDHGRLYVPFVTFTNNKNVVAVAYSSGLQGSWALAALFATDASYLNDPFAAIMGGSLLVSFDTPGPAPKTSDDVFVASIPLSNLPAGGAPFAAPLPAKIANVSKVDDQQGGPEDAYAQIVPGDGGLDMAWQRGLKTLVFAQGQIGGPDGTTWPSNATLLHVANDQAQQSLQMAAAGGTIVIARFISRPDQSSGPACCNVWATTNANGSWTNQVVGETNLALQKPGVAVSACGPSVAFQQALSGNQGRLTVATFEGGRWVHQSLAMNVAQPRLAPTPDGLDLVYQSGYGDIAFQHAKCFPPPAPLRP